MNQQQRTKIVSITPPAAIVDNAAFTTASVDTKGWRYCSLYIYLGALDIAVAAMKVRHSDDDSTYADVTGADFSVSPATLPAAIDDNLIFIVHLDTRGKKRYFDLSLTGGDGVAGSYITVFAILSRGETFPDTAAEQGASQVLTV